MTENANHLCKECAGEWGKSIALKFQEVDPLKGLYQYMETKMFLEVAFAAIVTSFLFDSNFRKLRKPTQTNRGSSLFRGVAALDHGTCAPRILATIAAAMIITSLFSGKPSLAERKK
ncbi:hypothetical protein V6N12_003301 [Hibiscus sabdariffa]|uniref:Uncharacterized protein n=1 Tax=Hibiscus sabdariffa TaxID=183260 RepID=A0ABR2EBH0_9ROSI